MDKNETKKPIVYILNGIAESGKDEFVLGLKSEYEVDNISSVDQIKKVATILGWNGKKDETSRKFLSDLKNLSTEFNNGPTNYMFDCVKSSDAEICVLHVREIHEIEKLKNLFKYHQYIVRTIKIERQSKLSTHVPQNTGDLNALQPYAYDCVVSNNGTIEDLHEKSVEITRFFMIQ